MENFNREEMYKKLKEILGLGKEDEEVISEFIQTEKMEDIFLAYETLPFTQKAKEKISALKNILSYEGEDDGKG